MKGPFSLLPPEDIYKFQALGIAPDKNDNLTITVRLSGRRYAARYLGLHRTPRATVDSLLRNRERDRTPVQGL